MKLDFSQSECQAGGESEGVEDVGRLLTEEDEPIGWSNTCEKDEGVCTKSDGFLNNSPAGTPKEVTTGLGEGYSHCINVRPGEFAEFTFKQANALDCGSFDADTVTVFNDTITCGNLPNQIAGCSQSGGQCL